METTIVSSPTPRRSNLELYRILAMLLIVMHHYVVNSGVIGEMHAQPTAPQSVFLYFMGMWGKTCINCFVLITGWFMCKKEITLRKFLKLLLWVEFYNVVIGGIFLLTGYDGYTLREYIWSLLPVTEIRTNFTTCFLLFYLFIPFLNILVRNMTQRQHLLLVLLCLSVYTFFPFVPKITVSFNYVVWFSVLYLISSYLRLYPIPHKADIRFWGKASVAAILAAVGSVSFFLRLTYLNTYGGVKWYLFNYYLVSDSNQLLAVAVGVTTFMFFVNLKIPQNKFINTVASSAFGVLLIHANSNAMRHWLWGTVCHNAKMFDSPFLVLHSLTVPVLVFSACIIIDQLRMRFLERPVLDAVENWCMGVASKFNKKQ